MRMAIRPAPINSMIDAARAFNGIVVSREKAQEAARFGVLLLRRYFHRFIGLAGVPLSL